MLAERLELETGRCALPHCASDRNRRLAERAPGAPPAPGMRWIPGRTFRTGSEDFYPEERPVRSVSVDVFWMDETPITATISGASSASTAT
jgi:formylglycine-generating enzyme